MSVQVPLDNKHTNKYGRLVMVKVSSKPGDKANKQSHTKGQTDWQTDVRKCIVSLFCDGTQSINIAVCHTNGVTQEPTLIQPYIMYLLGSSGCRNSNGGGCSHLCLSTGPSNDEFRCSCPSIGGLTLALDDKTCQGGCVCHFWLGPYDRVYLQTWISVLPENVYFIIKIFWWKGYGIFCKGNVQNGWTVFGNVIWTNFLI